MILFAALEGEIFIIERCRLSKRKKRKNKSKTIKYIFFVLCRMEVYEETDFMQEVTGIGELILPIAFAFTGRGDFVCPNTWNELFYEQAKLTVNEDV